MRFWCRLGFHSYAPCLEGYTCRILGSAFRHCVHCDKFQSYRNMPVSNDSWCGYSSDLFWCDWRYSYSRLIAVCNRVRPPVDVFALFRPSSSHIDILQWIDPIESTLFNVLDSDSYHLVFLYSESLSSVSRSSVYLASSSDVASCVDFSNYPRVVFSIKKSCTKGFSTDGRLLVRSSGDILCHDTIQYPCNPYDVHAYRWFCYGKLKEHYLVSSCQLYWKNMSTV